MFRPQIQKTRILAILALLNVVMVYWALNSYERHPTFGFELKDQASKIMESAINSLRASCGLRFADPKLLNTDQSKPGSKSFSTIFI